jgi:hypothetical protein
MSIWLAILLGVGIVGACAGVARRSGAQGIYVGIIESCLVMGAGQDCLQVRAYVDETLVNALPAPSKLAGRMSIRETNMSVPLMFVRVPPFVTRKIGRSDEWHERVDMPALPVIFRFDPAPDLALHAGQLVDVYIGRP